VGQEIAREGAPASFVSLAAGLAIAACAGTCALAVGAITI
jgi:hypothetical protein